LEFEYQFYLVRGSRRRSLRSLCSARGLRRFFVDVRGVVRGGVRGGLTANRTNNRSDWAKSRNKWRYGWKNAFSNGKRLPDSRNGFLGQPALLVGRAISGKSKGSVHFKANYIIT
jgi:hypothetical protein